MNYRLKKIPVTIITVSVLLILYSFLVRGYDPWGDDVYSYVITKIKVPLSLYKVDFILFESSYTHSLLVLFMLLGIGIYLFLFQEDENIISGLKTKKEFLFKLVNSGTNKIRTTNKDSIAPKDDKLDKKVTSFLPSVKLSVKLISMIVLILIIGLLLVNYWINLSNSSAPLSFWEAFFMAYGKYVFLVGLVMGGLAILQYVSNSNPKVQSEPENKSVNENPSTSVNVDNFSEINIPWYRKNWILLVVVLSLLMITTIVLVKNNNTSSVDVSQSKLETVEMHDYLGLSLNDEEVQNLFKQLGKKPEIQHFENSFFYIFATSGVAFQFSSEKRIEAILMYPDEYKFSEYQGKLPSGLNFNDKRKDVEAKLGEPTINGETNLFIWSVWEEGVKVTYKKKDTLDMSNEIEYITVL